MTEHYEFVALHDEAGHIWQAWGTIDDSGFTPAPDTQSHEGATCPVCGAEATGMA